jgi:hypothetical protein
MLRLKKGVVNKLRMDGRRIGIGCIDLVPLNI